MAAPSTFYYSSVGACLHFHSGRGVKAREACAQCLATCGETKLMMLGESSGVALSVSASKAITRAPAARVAGRQQDARVAGPRQAWFSRQVPVVPPLILCIIILLLLVLLLLLFRFFEILFFLRAAGKQRCTPVLLACDFSHLHWRRTCRTLEVIWDPRSAPPTPLERMQSIRGLPVASPWESFLQDSFEGFLT